jgi:ribosomal protein S18 acetylase RimI-like enzyme
MSETRVLAARDSERKRVLDVLVLAFAADPVERFLFPEADQYLAHFHEFLAAFGGTAFSTETVWRLDDFSAVALWLPPGSDPDNDAIVAAIAERVDPTRHEDLFSVAEQMAEAHPSFPHWYLPWFGVDPRKQGRGLGSELMEHCLALIDEQHLPAYLETPNPRTIPFYERHGFEVTAEAKAGACPPVVSMLRG